MISILNVTLLNCFTSAAPHQMEVVIVVYLCSFVLYTFLSHLSATTVGEWSK